MLSEQPLSQKLERLSAAATQTEDDIRYYSGGSKYNEPLEQLKDRLVHLYRTGQLVAVQADELKGEAMIDAVQKLIERGKATLDSDGYLVAYPFVQADDTTVRCLANEYRETMDRDVLHSWAKDIVAAISVLAAKGDA